MNRSASYVHALNGRLRIKLPELKGNPMRAQEIENQFNLMTGMQQVSANPVTGSLLFIYDPHLLKQEEICAVLKELGYFRDHSGRPDFFSGFGLQHSRGGGKNHHHAGLRSHGGSPDPPGGGAYLKKKQTPHPRNRPPNVSWYQPGNSPLFPQSASLPRGNQPLSLSSAPNDKCSWVARVSQVSGLKSPQDSGTGVDSGVPSTHRRFNITKVLKPNHR